MLLRTYKTYIPIQHGFTLAKLHQYIGTLNTQRKLITDRYVKEPGYESMGCRVLRHVIGAVDIDYLNSLSDDYTRYTHYLQHIVPELERIFDPVNARRIYHNHFIAKKSVTCDEIFVPVHHENYLSQLPMDKSFEEWKAVRPIRLLDYDSDELTLNTYTDQIVFQKDFVSRAIFSIDVVALVMQYAKFRQQIDPQKTISSLVYLHKYALPGILEDLVSLWLSKQYLHVMQLTDIDPDTFDISKHNTHPMYGYIGIGYPYAMRDVYQYVTQCRSGVVRPQALLSSLYTCKTSIPTYVKMLQQTCLVDDQRQVKWVEWLRDMRWFELLFTAVSLNKDFPEYTNLKRAMMRDFNLIANTRFWSMCPSVHIRAAIKAQVIRYTEIVESE